MENDLIGAFVGLHATLSNFIYPFFFPLDVCIMQKVEMLRVSGASFAHILSLFVRLP